MRRSETKANRLAAWGDSLINKLTSQTRKNRKRQASKKRRAQLKSQVARFIEEA